jgi:hypothetical protein
MNTPNHKGSERILALLSVIALSGTVPAFAGFSLGNAVTLGSRPAFRISASADGFSPEKRAWLAQDALDNALVLSTDKSPSAVSVERRNGAVIVALGGRKVATVDAGSARNARMSVNDLANQWADSIKNFLGTDKAADYIATLKSPNQLGASIAVVEKRLYAPAGTVMPVTFTEALSSETAVKGQRIEAKISQDVPLGGYIIPSGSLVRGELVETTPGTLSVTFSSLRTTKGTEMPISATASETYLVQSSGPHPVCTIGIPADPQANARIPANIGIGTVGGPGSTTLALQRGSSRVIAVGQPFNVVLDTVTPIAAVTRSTAM